uniref:Predicted gene 6569 n=1 Tax=Rattus norvegicus TaxID=10116 RepID=A0ABK0LZZ2_RAT
HGFPLFWGPQPHWSGPAPCHHSSLLTPGTSVGHPLLTVAPAAGPAAPPAPRFPDIYGGDAQLWEAHFRGIGRAYRALGKEDDFAIRVLTEDFTLPFPFSWPPGPDPATGPLFYDPRDRAGFDFLLRGPGAPPPALLRPLHATAQAAERKRRLERLALSYAGAGRPPGLVLLAPAAAFPSEAGRPAWRTLARDSE